MNKSLSFVFFLLVATFAYSQTSSGNMMAGGAIQFQSQSDQSGSASDVAYDLPSENIARGNSIQFDISPGAAFFFNEHWAMEMSFSLFGIRSSDPDTDNENDKVTTVSFGLNSFSPSLGLRYHF